MKKNFFKKIKIKGFDVQIVDENSEEWKSMLFSAEKQRMKNKKLRKIDPDVGKLFIPND